MLTIPFYKRTLYSNFEKSEINKILKGFIFQYQPKSIFSNKFYGELYDDGFEIYKNSFLFSTTLLKIYAIYKKVENKTEIKLKFTLSEHVLVFHMLLYVILFSILFFTITEAEELWLKLMPLVLIAINYLIVMVPFNLISHNCEQHLRSKLEFKAKA